MLQQETEVYRLNGLENIRNAVEVISSPSGRQIPVFEYSINGLQDSLTAYRIRNKAFRYDMLELSKLVNLSGEYDLLLIGIPVNEEDALILWKQTYRTQFSVPPEGLLLGICGWVDGVVDEQA